MASLHTLDYLLMRFIICIQAIPTFDKNMVSFLLLPPQDEDIYILILAPYGLPPQFGYYAPPAHSRQPPQPLNHPQHAAATEDIQNNSIRQQHPQQHPQHPNHPNSEEGGPAAGPGGETSEFGGLVSYFSSQQELD